VKFDKKFFVIPNYPQKYHFKPQFSREHFRELQGVKKDEKVVLFTALLTKVEGIDFLPKTAEKLFRKNKKVVLWIVGDGPLRSTIKELEREYRDNVKFFGWRPHHEIPDFINAADVCIGHYPENPLSSYYNAEGLHKIGEYMFFGKPIVACGLAESSQYLVVKENEMAEGILRAIKGETPKSTPKTWEGHSEKKILELFSWLKSEIVNHNKSP
jgi:glycosyltransferase involved in cell wall biosynthesis